MAFTSQQCGMSVMSRKDGFATDAYVCFDGVVNLVSEWVIPWPPVLGAILAHETGPANELAGEVLRSCHSRRLDAGVVVEVNRDFEC